MRFSAPADRETAILFLTELADAGLLFHPEEAAADCLAHHGLTDDTLAEIDRHMSATFIHLADPCEVALELINREAA